MDASPAHLYREETLEEVARPGNADLFGQAASRGDPAPAGSLLRAAIQPSIPWFSSQSGMPGRVEISRHAERESSGFNCESRACQHVSGQVGYFCRNRAHTCPYRWRKTENQSELHPLAAHSYPLEESRTLQRSEGTASANAATSFS